MTFATTLLFNVSLGGGDCIKVLPLTLGDVFDSLVTFAG